MLRPKIIKGSLISYLETGTEGIIWSLYRKPSKAPSAYDDLFCLNGGDHLMIFDKKIVIWIGVIEFDWEINYKKYPKNPKYGQQNILGYWVHGVQKGIAPELWASWFNLLGEKEYTGKLVRNVKT